MNSSILEKLDLHQKWLTSVGMCGEKLNLDEVNLQSIKNMRFYSLKESSITECIFDNMILDNSNFILALLCLSTFKNASLNNADFYKANVSYVDFSGAILSNSKFRDCDCIETIFYGADLSNSDITLCNFYQSDLRRTKLFNANIEDSVFEETLLSGADIRKIKGFDKAMIKSINLGTLNDPIILLKEEAERWMKEQI